MSEQQNQNTEQQSTEEQAPNITIDDIVLTQRVIAQASARGAFRAEEMEVVGGLYNRISRFVKYHTPAEKQEGGEGTKEEAPAENTSEGASE